MIDNLQKYFDAEKDIKNCITELEDLGFAFKTIGNSDLFYKLLNINNRMNKDLKEMFESFRVETIKR